MRSRGIRGGGSSVSLPQRFLNSRSYERHVQAEPVGSLSASGGSIAGACRVLSPRLLLWWMCRHSAAAGARGPVRVVAEKVVGIDLGTTNSAVAAMEGSRPTIVTNAEGQRTTPSVVAYTKAGDRLVGQVAKRQAVVNPENTFFSVKRFIGRKMDEVADESKQVSYNVTRDSNGNVKLECPATGKQFAAEEISAQVLQGAAVLPGHPPHVAQSLAWPPDERVPACQSDGVH